MLAYYSVDYLSPVADYLLERLIRLFAQQLVERTGVQHHRVVEVRGVNGHVLKNKFYKLDR